MSVRQDPDLLQGSGNGSDEPSNKRQRRQVRDADRISCVTSFVCCTANQPCALLLDLYHMPARCLTYAGSADPTSGSGTADVRTVASHTLASMQPLLPFRRLLWSRLLQLNPLRCTCTQVLRQESQQDHC